MSVALPNVDLRPDHWAIVRDALRRHVPDREVLAFGSRATWTAKDYSDLDLAIMGGEPLSLRAVSALDEALVESGLPFRVDIVDWARIDDGFRSIIRRDGVVVQAAEGAPTGIGPGQQSSTANGKSLDASSQLSVHAEIVMGQSPPGNKSNNTGEGVPLLNGPTEFGSHHPEPKQYTTDVRKAACPGDLLFCVRGSTTGRMNWADQDYAIGRGIAAIRHKRGQQYQPFVRAVIEYSLPSLLKQATGSTFPNVSARQLAGVSWPPLELPEQRAIAHVLGTLDDKIELNRRMNETLEAMARALFKSWFVDFDPVRAKMEGRDTGLPEYLVDLFPGRLVDSEMGEIPEAWEVTTLEEHIEVNPRRSLRRGQTAPYLPMAKMPTRGHMPDPVAVRPFGSGMRFANGDTLVARITPCLENGKTAYVDFLTDGEIGWGSTEYIVLRPQPPLPGQFAYCLARSSKFREFAIQNMSGTSGRQRVPPTALRGFLMVVPPRPLAARFGEVARSLFERARNAGDESRTLAALRDTLLPKLISGEIRVPDAERALESAT